MRRRRNEVTVEIRKTKRDDTLQKRRNVPLTEDTTDEEEGRENLSAASLDTIVERAMSPEPETQLAAVQVRKLLI
jgi:importin subunit alpha-4/3